MTILYTDKTVIVSFPPHLDDFSTLAEVLGLVTHFRYLLDTISGYTVCRLTTFADTVAMSEPLEASNKSLSSFPSDNQ